MSDLPVIDTTDLPTIFPAADRARSGALLPTGRRVHRTTCARRSFRDARRTAAAAEVLTDLPAAGEALHFIADTSFELCAIIARIIELAGSPCRRLTVATLGLHQRTLDILLRLSDAAAIKRIDLLASAYFRSVDVDLWTRTVAELTRRGHHAAAARAHAKLQLYDFADGRRFVVESSSNLRSCKCHEQTTLIHDPGLYDFHFGWTHELIAEARRCDVRNT